MLYFFIDINKKKTARKGEIGFLLFGGSRKVFLAKEDNNGQCSLLKHSCALRAFLRFFFFLLFFFFLIVLRKINKAHTEGLLLL